MLAGTLCKVLVSQGAVLRGSTLSRRRPAAGPSRGVDAAPSEEVEAVRRKRDAHLEGCEVEGKVRKDFLDVIGEWWFRIRSDYPPAEAERGLGDWWPLKFLPGKNRFQRWNYPLNTSPEYHDLW